MAFAHNKARRDRGPPGTFPAKRKTPHFQCLCADRPRILDPASRARGLGSVLSRSLFNSLRQHECNQHPNPLGVSLAMGTFPGMLPPPPGQEPNFANPESVGWQLILCASLCIVGAIVFVSVRMYTAHFVAQKVRVDDCAFLLGEVKTFE